MALPEQVYQSSKDERQAAKMAREAKGLRKKAKRRGFITPDEERDLSRAERFLQSHPVNAVETHLVEYSELA